jgi:site-specific DNA recombinase
MNSAENDSLKAIATYGRVSTGRQEDEETIKTQLSAVKEYAAKHGCKIVSDYRDEGWSGDILARPGLDQLRADARKKLWQAVLIYDPDRLARRYFYQELVLDELRELGIETLFVTMPPVQNDEDRLMFGVRGVFAQYERVKIAERFRLGKIRKAKDGNVVASEAPYGYTLVTKTGRRGDPEFCDTHYMIDAREARVVRTIFEWVGNEGLTLRKVVKRLHEMSVQPRKSKRGVWNTSTLSKLVRNRTYIGEGHYGSSYGVVPENPWKKDTYRKVRKSSRKSRPANEWILMKVPAIFEGEADRALFMRAQLQLKHNFEMSQRNKKNQYLLAGKMRCTCGRARTGEGPQQGKYLYYRCTGRIHAYPLPAACNERGINARTADDLVWRELRQLMSSGGLMLKQIQAWKDSRLDRNKVPMTGAADTEEEVQKLRQQEHRLTEAYAAGVVTIEKLRQYLEPLQRKISELEKRAADIKERAPQADDNVGIPLDHEVEAFAQMVADTFRDLSFEEKRAIVKNTIDKVIGTRNELGSEIHVYGFIPIKNYVEFKTNDRHGVSAARLTNLAKIPSKFLIDCRRHY